MNADEAFVQALDTFGRERMLYGAGLALAAGAAGLLVWEVIRSVRNTRQQAQAQRTQQAPDATQLDAFGRWPNDYGYLNS